MSCAWATRFAGSEPTGGSPVTFPVTRQTPCAKSFGVLTFPNPLTRYAALKAACIRAVAKGTIARTDETADWSPAP